jgi:spore maturation protein B
VARVIAVILAVAIVLVGALRHVDVYAAFADGAQEGLKTAFQVMPYLCAALLLIAFLRGSGVLAWAQDALEPLFSHLGLPKELLPFLLIRPVSGSGSLSVLKELIDRLGVDSDAALMAAALMGSSETTLYVLSLYLGSVKMRSGRYCVAVSLISAVFGAVFALISLNYV